MKLETISPSRIKTWDQCRFKYWLTYNTDIELKSNWGAAHGSLIHDILENYSNNNEEDWLDRLYRGYAGTLETLDRYQQLSVMESPLVWAKKAEFANKTPFCESCPYKDADNGVCSISQEPLDNLSGCPKDLFNESITMLQGVIDRYQEIWPYILKDDDRKPIGIEYPIKLSVPGTKVIVNGYMDLVVAWPDNTIEIIDYKAGKFTQNYEECLGDIQVKTYGWAGRKIFVEDVLGLGFSYDNVFLTFDYFRNKPITTAFSEEDDLETEQFLIEKIKEIENAHQIFRCVKDPSTFWKCKYMCDVDVCNAEWKGAFDANT